LNNKESEDEVLAYLGEDDCYDLPSCLFPGEFESGYSRQIAFHYSQQFESTGNSAYAILSAQLSLRYGHPVEQSVATFLADGFKKYICNVNKPTLEHCLNLKGVGSSTAFGKILKERRNSDLFTNLYVLCHVVGFDRSTSGRLVWERDASSEMEYKAFRNIMTKFFNTIPGDPLYEADWYWYTLLETKTTQAYLETFLHCKQLEPRDIDALNEKISTLKQDSNSQM